MRGEDGVEQVHRVDAVGLNGMGAVGDIAGLEEVA